MDWSTLYFGGIRRKDIQQAIQDPEWQKVRVSMLGTTVQFKYVTLHKWLSDQSYSDKSKVQVTNYVTALSRGGIIRPDDYLRGEALERSKVTINLDNVSVPIAMDDAKVSTHIDRSPQVGEFGNVWSK